MKYWNKQKEVRLRCWTKICLMPVKQINSSYTGWTNLLNFERLKRTLQQKPSKGKFYMDLSYKEVWFEQQSDAVMFALEMELIR